MGCTSSTPTQQYSSSFGRDLYAVIVPANIFPGDVIHIQTPDSKLYEITVPQGAGQFSRLIVRIPPSLPTNTMNPSSYNMNTNYAQPSAPIVSATTVPGTIPIVNTTSPDGYASPYQPQKPYTPSVYVPH